MTQRAQAKPKAGEKIHSILLVDDEPRSLNIYKSIINKMNRYVNVDMSQFPKVALGKALNKFYDIILIDVTMNYNVTQFGGFELYKNLVGRYGDDSMLLYSQYVNEELLAQYGYNYNFIEKGADLEVMEFVEKVLERCDALRRQQSCFVAMPFDSKFDAVYEVIRDCIEVAAYRPVKVNEQVFNKSIVEKVFEDIRAAKLVVFLAADRNPNAFYECGYAVALNKEIITVTDVFSNLPFDIRDRNAIAFGSDSSDPTNLRSELIKKLSALTTLPGP